jgi:hypothetical protein
MGITHHCQETLEPIFIVIILFILLRMVLIAFDKNEQ